MSKREPGIGHNSGETPAHATGKGVAADELKSFVERVERLTEEKQAIADDIKDVFAEMKGRGFDTKAVRRILALRKIDRSALQEMKAILELYADALGMPDVFA